MCSARRPNQRSQMGQQLRNSRHSAAKTGAACCWRYQRQCCWQQAQLRHRMASQSGGGVGEVLTVRRNELQESQAVYSSSSACRQAAARLELLQPPSCVQVGLGGGGPTAVMLLCSALQTANKVRTSN